jgi:hypothetical protein
VVLCAAEADWLGPQERLCPILLVAVVSGLTAWAAWRHRASPVVTPTEAAPERKNDSSELRRWYAMSDVAVMEATQDDVQRFIASRGSAEPNFGISRGPYAKIGSHSRLPRTAGYSSADEVQGLRFACNFNAFTFRPANSTPDDAPPSASLLLPGKLSQRSDLPNTVLCFLFYAERLWTRATGGAKGVTLARVVAGDNRIGDKEVLAECLADYERKHHCDVSGGYPSTVLLSDRNACEQFFNANHLWAAEEDTIWFVKDAHGSLGRHIQLLRRKDVSAMAANRSYTCPMPARVASLEVANIWIPGRKKFDQRFYVLVPSLNPLIVLVRRGYLRYSTVDYTRARADGENAEQDRMRHVTNLAIQLYDVPMPPLSPEHDASAAEHTGEDHVVQPPSRLQEELLKELGPEEGRHAHTRLERSARSSILQVIYALRHKLAPWDMSQKNISQTWALLSMDVAYDTANNAYVLDVNARPAPTGTKYPSWYARARFCSTGCTQEIEYPTRILSR